MSAFTTDLTIRLGEPFGPERIQFTDPDGAPSDLAGATLTLTVHPLGDETNLLSKQLSPTEVAGEAALSLAVGEVDQQAAHVEQTLRYRVADGTGRSLARGWVYVAPQWGAV